MALDFFFNVEPGAVVLASTDLLEENARANPDARIRPLTHVSVDRAYKAPNRLEVTLYLVFLLLFVALQIYK